ncbi:MAG: hypothetical protein IJD20_03225, partial [Oscillospiraceae bacterium]|nr:hypothetical protein [Oscillospiraceae bacterium]
MNRKPKKWTRAAISVSAVGVALSISLCVGPTLARFTDALLNIKNDIVIGSFGVAATLSDTPLPPVAGVSYPAGTYELRVAGTGTTAGYARICLQATQSETPQEVYSTELLSAGTGAVYSLTLNEETKVWVEPVWSE